MYLLTYLLTYLLAYLLTCLLTYFFHRKVFLEKLTHSQLASQEIRRIIRNPKVHYCVYKNQPPFLF